MHHREGKTGLTLRRLRQVLGTEPALSFTSRPPSEMGWAGLASLLPRPDRNNLTHLHLEFTLSQVDEAPTASYLLSGH